MVEKLNQRVADDEDQPGDQHGAFKLFPALSEDQGVTKSDPDAGGGFEEHLPLLQKLFKKNVHCL